MEPLQICGLLLMSVLTLFFLLLIVVAMVRVIGAPVQYSENVKTEMVMAVDLLVTDAIAIFAADIAKNQDLELEAGMSILISQNTNDDGLYLLDESKDLIRVDCLRNDYNYHINTGKSKNSIFTPNKDAIKQNQVEFYKLSVNSSLNIGKTTAEVIVLFENDVHELTLHFEDISCMFVVMNTCLHPVTILSSLQKKKISVNPGKHTILITRNHLQIF